MNGKWTKRKNEATGFEIGLIEIKTDTKPPHI